ncbi:MAG: hypothetical protein K6G03_01995, partial [Lachnospiraceae bacterium]|nr:hypothetical protein [Lachnospiraceae bacterium]
MNRILVEAVIDELTDKERSSRKEIEEGVYKEALREQLAYVLEQRFRKIPIEQIDVLVKILRDEVRVDIRCIGEPIDPTAAAG